MDFSPQNITSDGRIAEQLFSVSEVLKESLQQSAAWKSLGYQRMLAELHFRMSTDTFSNSTHFPKGELALAVARYDINEEYRRWLCPHNCGAANLSGAEMENSKMS